MKTQRLSRRDFMRMTALTAAGTVLAACAPEQVVVEKEVPVEVEVPVEQTVVVKETVVVEQEGDEVLITVAPPEPQTIEMWMWETEPRWMNVEATSGVNDLFPHVTFKWTALPFDQLHDKAIVSLAAGVAEGLPDIIRTYMGFYLKMAQSEAIADVTEIVTPHKNDILPARWEQLDYKGKIYNVPDDTGVMQWGYRWDIFEEAGLPSAPDEVRGLLATYDDLIEVAKEIEGATGAKAFNMSATGAGGVFDEFARQDTTGGFDKEGNVIFDSETHQQAALAVQRIWDAGITMDLESPVMWQAYKDKELCMMRYPNWQDFVIIDAAPELAGKWRVTRLPAVVAGGKRANTSDGCCLIIPDIIPLEKKVLAIEIAEYMKLTTPATVAHMMEFSGAFVTYIPGLEAMKNVPSPILDGQYVYQIYLQAAQEEDVNPWYRSSAFFNDANDAMADAMFRVLTEGAAVDAALAEAADSIRDLQKSKGEM